MLIECGICITLAHSSIDAVGISVIAPLMLPMLDPCLNVSSAGGTQPTTEGTQKLGHNPVVEHYNSDLNPRPEQALV